jgi:hypothetical protein
MRVADVVQKKQLSSDHSHSCLDCYPSDSTMSQTQQDSVSQWRLHVVPRVHPNNSSERKRCELLSNALQPELGYSGCPSLLSFDEMPEWFQHDNNRWTVRGYRPISDSVHESLRSLCYAHNETVNIYSISFRGSSSSLASGTSCGTLLADMTSLLQLMPPFSLCSCFQRPSAIHSRRCIIL